MKKREEEVRGIYIDLPVPLFDRLEQFAETKFWTKRTVVVQALRAYLEKEEK